jgi:hypothetical protein
MRFAPIKTDDQLDLNGIAGGWAADVQFTVQTGFPFSVGTNLGSAGPNGGSANAILVRNPFVPGGTPGPSNPSITCAATTWTRAYWYNPRAFANPKRAFPDAATAVNPVSAIQITGLSALPYLGGRLNTVYGPGYERVNASGFARASSMY